MKFNAKLLFVTIYLIVDLIYVISSKDVYNNVVINIQGRSMPNPKGTRLFAGLAAYICMALGWYFLVADKIERSGASKVQSAIFYGVIFGLSVYGTFNFTLHVMLDNYDIPIVLRDLIWGTSWVTILSTMYALYLQK